MNANALVTLPTLNAAKSTSIISARTRGELKAALYGAGLWILYIGTVHTAHLIGRLTGMDIDAHNVNIGATVVALAAAGLLYLRRRSAH